ncbi:MAG: transglycosylase SLT domain-containing protein [Bacteroidales bacterium]|nr:transglycosylase SLT domain-containing protein [Bacteroidales bacterium]
MRKRKIPYLFYVLLIHSVCLTGQPSYTIIIGEISSANQNPGEEGSPNISYDYYIEKLNKQTPIDLVYNNDVRQYIDWFLKGRRNELITLLERSEKYFPLIEEIMDKYDLPLELKYMAVVESGLNPFAKSKSGAVGMWQFLYNTCTLVDLDVNSYIDERRDSYKSTEAACKYLRYLFDTFHDWNLVIASYNGGPGEVRKAMERSGGKTDYWEIRPYLSAQTSNYVPAFIAMNYLMNYYGMHGIEYQLTESIFQDTDTLHIRYAVSFEQISKVLNLPVSKLEELNPVYKRGFIPNLEEPCILVLPKEKAEDYLRYENRIIGYIVPKTDYNTLLSNAGSTTDREKIIHVVKPGEYFHKIAINYKCTVENIKAWNQLQNFNLFPGQTLEIWVKNDHLN